MGQRSSLNMAGSIMNCTTLNGNLTKQVFCQNPTSPSSAKKFINKIKTHLSPKEYSSLEKAEEIIVLSNKLWDNRWRATLTKKPQRRLILISTSSFRNNRQLRLSNWFNRKQQHLHLLKALPLPKIMRSPLEQEYTHKAHNPREILKLMIVDQIGD